jgi:hypothetical protein
MTLFKVKVCAKARRNFLIATDTHCFAIEVKAKPENGRANDAVLTLLARHLGVESKRLRIVRGASSPSKIIALLG